ncbi:alpha/beta hydrolase [Pseudonocardia sp. CA-107938]|uniref:alpha/beta hydrolase n=1 Tax=Pseudonocardia sp. CA-107938 TaxID=3240021 RepID=UPI003D8C7A66
MSVQGDLRVVAGWREPAGIAPRGTVVVVPGRGEHPGVYERFGHRIAADGYRVWAVPDPTQDEAGVTALVRGLLESTDDGVGPQPRVLVGSDSGALFAAGLAAGGQAAGLVLAGLPGPDAVLADGDWEAEVAARTACPTHQGRLTADAALRRGALREALPAGWAADPGAITVPVLGLHGDDDAVSPLSSVRDWYAGVKDAELVAITGGRHDALNDQTHRTAAATIVLFLERLRAGVPAIARPVTA